MKKTLAILLPALFAATSATATTGTSSTDAMKTDSSSVHSGTTHSGSMHSDSAQMDAAKSDLTQLTKTVGADAASQITFEPGRATLTSEEIKSLNDIVSNARMNNSKIDEVKVFVWGDNVYADNQRNKVTSQERKVADDRVKNIKNYLSKELNVKDIETFNMARESRSFADLIPAAGSKVRDIAPQGAVSRSASTTAGTTPITPKSISDFTKGSPSEALVLIYKE